MPCIDLWAYWIRVRFCDGIQPNRIRTLTYIARQPNLVGITISAKSTDFHVLLLHPRLQNWTVNVPATHSLIFAKNIADIVSKGIEYFEYLDFATSENQ